MKHQTVDNMEEEEEGNEGFGICNDSMNTSYEDVEEEANPTFVDFGAGDKMELVAHFLNKKFNVEHIRSFALDSPIDRSNVIFIHIPSILPHYYERTKSHITKWQCTV